MWSYSLFRQKSAYISWDRSHENNGDHNAEENNDHDRVNNTEPVYSWVENVQVIVPTGSLEDANLTSGLNTVVHVPMEYPIPVNSDVKIYKLEHLI